STTPSADATMYAPSTIDSNSATAIGSNPVGTVASSSGRAPYEAAASDRIDTGFAGSTGAPGLPAERATRASRVILASVSMPWREHREADARRSIAVVTRDLVS